MVLYVNFLGAVGNLKKGQLGGMQVHFYDNKLKLNFIFEIGQKPDDFNNHFRFPYSAKKFRAVNVHKKLDLYPSIEELRDIFRWDQDKDKTRLIKKPPVDALIGTHFHYDHMGGIGLIRPDIPVYISKLAKMIAYNWQYLSGGTINEVVDMSAGRSLAYSKTGSRQFLKGDITKVQKDIRTFNDFEPFFIKGMEVIPIPIDHSLPGSYGFIMKTSAGNIGFSGDFRSRGLHHEKTERFLEELIKHNISHFFCEGSLLHFGHGGSEEIFPEKFADVIKDKSFAAVAYPPRDFDRITSLYKAAKITGRMLLVTPAQAVYLKSFNGVEGYPKLNWKYIGIYVPKKKKGTLDEPGYEDMIKKDYVNWENEFVNLKIWDKHEGISQRVRFEDIKKYKKKFIMCLPENYLPGELSELNLGENDIYIRSHPAPWTKELEISENTLINNLKRIGFPIKNPIDYFNPLSKVKVHQMHITGHHNDREQIHFFYQLPKHTQIIIDHAMFPEQIKKEIIRNRDVIIPFYNTPFTLENRVI